MDARTIPSLLAIPETPFCPGGPTVGQIAARAAGIGEALARLGAPADEPVALCVEGRANLLACLLASLAGAPPLILPHAFERPTLDEARKAHPFALLLADGPVEAPAGTTVLALADCPPSPGGATLRPVRPLDAPFLFLFTGGSTGTPRLWSKTPANLFGEALHLARSHAVGPADRILATVPPRHIYGLLASVLLPFVARASVVDRSSAFPREILGGLEEGATILVGVPAHYGAVRGLALRPGALRLALSSAAPLDPGDAEAFREGTGIAITEIYGSTETGGMATRVGGGQGPWTPFTGLDWRIGDERLCIRSPFLSPDLPRDAAGFFQTADRVADVGGGRFAFLGRADQIIKIAGKRVDLAEIRERVRRIPGVRDAQVVALPRRGVRHAEIAALVVTDLAAGELAAALRNLEIPYGRLRRVRIVPEIPVLPNGKLDREALTRLLTPTEWDGPNFHAAPCRGTGHPKIGG